MQLNFKLLHWLFFWIGKRYLWHIPQLDAEYSSDILQQKEIAFPDLEKQDREKNLFNVDTASESFKHKFLDAHRCWI